MSSQFHGTHRGQRHHRFITMAFLQKHMTFRGVIKREFNFETSLYFFLSGLNMGSSDDTGCLSFDDLPSDNNDEALLSSDDLKKDAVPLVDGIENVLNGSDNDFAHLSGADDPPPPPPPSRSKREKARDQPYRSSPRRDRPVQRRTREPSRPSTSERSRRTPPLRPPPPPKLDIPRVDRNAYKTSFTSPTDMFNEVDRIARTIAKERIYARSQASARHSEEFITANEARLDILSNHPDMQPHYIQVFIDYHLLRMCEQRRPSPPSSHYRPPPSNHRRDTGRRY